MRPGGFFRARLHRRLFVWFGLTIIATAIVVGVAQSVVYGPAGWKRDVEGALRFVASRVALAWDDEPARTELLATLAAETRVGVVLEDDKGRVLLARGECGRATAQVPVRSGGQTLGTLRACPGAGHNKPGSGVLGLGAALVMLWLLSGALARRILRPLREVARVAEAIGDGDLDARVRLRGRRHRHGRHHGPHHAHHPGHHHVHHHAHHHAHHPPHHGDDVENVGRTLNQMADRIQKQIEDQRELLAAVSHEMRTPLGHLRVITEVLREQRGDGEQVQKHVAAIEREVTEMDDLIGQLLASSRLDFSALQTAREDAVELARRALDRAGLPDDRLAVSGEPGDLAADATLLLRALANLIDNAQHHGGGLVTLRVSADEEGVRFAACDDGDGFAPGDEERAFAAFFSRAKTGADGKGSLGLGLALVRRIAEAHGGRAFVERRDGDGACVGFVVPVG